MIESTNQNIQSKIIFLRKELFISNLSKLFTQNSNDQINTIITTKKPLFNQIPPDYPRQMIQKIFKDTKKSI